MLGYGAGIIPGRFGANRSIRIDIIPVDFVANACLVAAAHLLDQVVEGNLVGHGASPARTDAA